MVKKDALIAEVLQQIQQDLYDGHSDALYALLMSVRTDQLLGFLPRPTQQYLAQVDQ